MDKEAKPAEKKHFEKKEDKKEKAPEQKAVVRARDVIRFIDTTIEGTEPVRNAIRHIKGVSFSFANAVSNVCAFSDKRVNELTEDEMKTLEDIILNPSRHGIPLWLFNRRFDPKTGESRHLTASTLDFAVKMDINEMKRLRTYKGVRHSLGLPVRGQRTRSTSRQNKTVGVMKKKGGAAAPVKERGK